MEKIIIICQFCWLVVNQVDKITKKKYTQHKHKHKGGANLSRQKSRENFAPPNKYFQASIGNHLKTNKKQQQARHAKLSPAEWPPPASGFGTK